MMEICMPLAGIDVHEDLWQPLRWCEWSISPPCQSTFKWFCSDVSDVEEEDDDVENDVFDEKPPKATTTKASTTSTAATASTTSPATAASNKSRLLPRRSTERPKRMPTLKGASTIEICLTWRNAFGHTKLDLLLFSKSLIALGRNFELISMGRTLEIKP